MVCLAGSIDGAAGQSLPRDLTQWSLEYGVNGGIAGVMRRVTLASDGAVAVEDRLIRDRLTGRVSDDLMARIAASLQVARDERPSTVKGPPMPDQMGGWLSLTTGGREYRLEITSEMVDLIDAAAAVAER